MIVAAQQRVEAAVGVIGRDGRHGGRLQKTGMLALVQLHRLLGSRGRCGGGGMVGALRQGMWHRHRQRQRH